MSGDRNRIHTFLLLKEPGRPERIVVWDTHEISLGRSAENDIAIEHAEMSRRQARFLRGDKSHAVQNLSGSNPTLVNDAAVETQTLQSRDVIRIADLEIVFYQSAKDPIALGRPLEYASQLKEFAGPRVQAGDGESTILGLVDSLDTSDEAFEVKPARDFAYELHDLDPALAAEPSARDLDLELEDFGLDDLELPVAEPVAQVRAGDAPAFFELEDVAGPPPTLSLHLEIQGLAGELQRILQALIGKQIEIPPLKIRIVDDDLG